MARPYGWTPERDIALLEHLPTMTFAALAEKMGCEESSIRRRLKKIQAMGIRIPERKVLRAKKLPEPTPVPTRDHAKPKSSVTGWEDGWRILPPTISDLSHINTAATAPAAP